jgi:hypothetical protein
MKHVFCPKALALTALIGSAAHASYGATNGTLVIAGTVPSVAEISIAAVPGASNLPLGSSVSGLKIATVSELCNDASGYTVQLSSENGGSLKDPKGSGSLPYTLSYNGTRVVFLSGIATISDVSTTTPASGHDKDLSISFAASSLAGASYADTLTLTITAK